ncbi:hypothetical protein [Streptomyces sp. NPDC006012]|uniref:hypothetical protein n=1 Tax=Streptomyces sp. NPDC006012 TaxID=3364739 RepID=UPI0036A6F16D
MRTTRLLIRSGPILAVAAALPISSAGPSLAASGISASANGSTVSVTTSACTQINGNWGSASLLTGDQRNFAEGRQTPLSGTTAGQSAAWSNVAAGTYTAVVVCSNGTSAGSQSVVVSAPKVPQTAKDPAAPAVPAVPAVPPPAVPQRGVLGGLGGTVRDYGPLTLGAGAALVGGGVIATAWYLRRRARPHGF